jgi:enoyl-CoA hydratase/3-hydroxyacyl-CoA dehydrogenase
VAAARALLQDHLSGKAPIKRLDPAPLAVPAVLPRVDIGHRSLAVDRILTDVIRAGLAVDLDQGLAIEADGFAQCKRTVDYDIGMGNFIQNGPRVPAVFMHE